MTTNPTRRDRGRRSDYTPSVRARAARNEGQRRLTPGYLEDLSDTKFKFIQTTADSATHAAVTPSIGKRIRLIRLSVTQVITDGLHQLEVYFGTGNQIADNPEKAIDYVRIPDLGRGDTRTWGRGAGPIGAKNEVLTYRFGVTTPTTAHKMIIEYTEER